MEDFVKRESVVRQIYGKSDTILLIFAGAAAEFALSKAVDWLYFTGRLPADPIGRFLSTVAYARKIVFSSQPQALAAIDAISAAHAKVEKDRAARIPDWAHRDVLFMLIDYSIRSYELLERPLKPEEKEEVFDVFLRVGRRLNIPDLPETYAQWTEQRTRHLRENLEFSDFTRDLFQRYRRHLGPIRYRLLLELQAQITPPEVGNLLKLRKRPFIRWLVSLYKLSRWLGIDRPVRELLLPAAYRGEIKKLDRAPVKTEMKKLAGP